MLLVADLTCEVKRGSGKCLGREIGGESIVINGGGGEDFLERVGGNSGFDEGFFGFFLRFLVLFGFFWLMKAVG